MVSRDNMMGLRGYSVRRPQLHTGNLTTASTLIQLLVVIAIIGILASLLFPGFVGTKTKAQSTGWQANVRQLGLVLNLYLGGRSACPFRQAFRSTIAGLPC